MNSFGTQLNQLPLLIDKIHHHQFHNLKFNKYDYDKLLELSEQIDYPYGKALAHVHLAKYYQMVMEDEAYQLHLEKAKGIAGLKNYFDILVQYFKLEGFRNCGICDDMAELTNYLEGAKLASEIKDNEACSAFYNNIAEVFFRCGAYGDAEAFYQKALSFLENGSVLNANYCRKSIQINLLRLFCMQGNLENAAKYREQCRNNPCELGILPMLFQEEEIRFLLLNREPEAASQKTDNLIETLLQYKSDEVLLQTIYLSLMELLLVMERKESASWCLNRLDILFQNCRQNVALRIRKLHVQYAVQFGIADGDHFEAFYHTAQKSETVNHASTADSFKHLFKLYETAKEQNRMIEEYSDLQTAADRDELTKIYNHRYYSKLISKFLQDDRISALGCIMVDVDFFKEYNDHYGHLKGDHVLQEVAALLSSLLPEGAYAARYGGDEFSCLFIDQEETEMIAFVKRVQEALYNLRIRHTENKNSNLLTLSFGIYNETCMKNCDVDQLIKRADEALYQAKKSGRNSCAVYGQRR